MKLSLDKFKNDWRNATLSARIRFVITLSLGIVGAAMIFMGHLDYDKVSGLWISDTNWQIGLILYLFFSFAVIVQSKWKLSK